MINASLTELAAALTARKVSSVELTEFFIDRIGRLDKVLNAFITVDPDRSLAQARDRREQPRPGGKASIKFAS